MATLQTKPDSVPDDAVEWTRELNVSQIGRVGYLNMHFTNWDATSTTVPNVVEGSTVEISNSLYVETANVALNTTGQTANAINWVIYKVSGSVATAYLEPTAPTIADYDADKKGFYDSSGNRWTGHYMFVSAAGTAYSNKGVLDYAGGAMLRYRIDDDADDFVIDAKLDVKETLNVDGNTDLGGTCAVSGNTTVGGTLGVTSAISGASINTDNADLKMKVLSGTGTGSTTLNIAHGLTTANIRGIACTLDRSASGYITGYKTDGTDVVIVFSTGLSSTVYVVVFYI